MKMLYVGGKCKEHCFADFGGCNVRKGPRDEELTIRAVRVKIRQYFAEGERIFLYTPDMFSDIYHESIFQKLPTWGAPYPNLIAINASVRTFIDKKITAEQLLEKGVFQIWFGLESASDRLRQKYGKPRFMNYELIDATARCKEHGIEVGWYLIDSKYDTIGSINATYQMLANGRPDRIQFTRLSDES